MLRCKVFAVVALAWMTAGVAVANESARRADIWELLPLGRHYSELPTEYTGYACGTDGGPPSRMLQGWGDFKECTREARTGFQEVRFEYDDEALLTGLAHQYTSRTSATLESNHVVIVSALFSADGFLVGIRMVTDPDVPVDDRAGGNMLLTSLAGRYDGKLACTDAPPAPGETPAGATFIKVRCLGQSGEDAVSISADYFRRKGHSGISQHSPYLGTVGQFWSETRFEQIHAGPIENRTARAKAGGNKRPVENPAALQALDCAGCDLSGADLSNSNLQQANLAGADLSGASLHRADLTGANLSGANLSGANMNAAVLIRANLEGANLAGATGYAGRFNGANLYGALLAGALLSTSDFSSALLEAADLAEADLSGATLAGTRLTGAELIGANLARVRAKRAIMIGADLTDAILYEADLSAADLTDAVAVKADVRGADLRRATLINADFTDASFAGAKVSGSTTDGATFSGATELPISLRAIEPSP